MLIALFCLDKENTLDLRLATREAHLAYIAETRDIIHLGGPLLDDAGDMCGSMVVLNVADKSAAETWAANDPYAKAGLFQSVTMKQWKQVE